MELPPPFVAACGRFDARQAWTSHGPRVVCDDHGHGVFMSHRGDCAAMTIFPVLL
ncbi:hypothetical protein [Luteimonas kalidii]|uniref:Uncharacterized protein n=1 Tax=Luteimonas kalidii TaxID=3042025 RepID=A0ABT6JNS2_9GAMM|nr:hypothetical protein [Luteimonas kalidii]MDH5832323.1 hypothetical protein [Luteimonas kalidii]